MSRFAWVVDRVIKDSNIVLEILDARFIQETQNKEIEDKIKSRNKILIQVVNKCDHVPIKELLGVKKELKNGVFISATKHLGTTILKDKIKMLARRNNISNPVVGVIGYPNVGKSSVINVLKGKKSAKTSSEAGYTKGKQLIRINKNIMMIDTPGVIEKNKNNEIDLALIGAKNPSTIKDPDLGVLKLMKNYPKIIEKHYDVKIRQDKEKTIEDIAVKLNLKKKHDLPDIERVSRKILKDWIDGKINK